MFHDTRQPRTRSLKVIAGITGVILAGGQSRRFGANKALALLAGRRLIEHPAGVLSGLFAQRLLVTNTPEQYDFLGWPMIADRFPGAGPWPASMRRFVRRKMNGSLSRPATCPPFARRRSIFSALAQADGMPWYPGCMTGRSRYAPSMPNRPCLRWWSLYGRVSSKSRPCWPGCEPGWSARASCRPTQPVQAGSSTSTPRPTLPSWPRSHHQKTP